MTEQFRKLRVFVASPRDVVEERRRLSPVIDELNRSVAKDKGLVLELIRWETHATPDMGRSQEIISRQISRYDIFIGIMWKRFGTHTGLTESGTQEEFNLAYRYWKKTGRPRIMFYFNQAPYTLRSIEEVEQVQKVLDFRKQLEQHGLIWEYNGADDLERTVREHLTSVIRELKKEDLDSASEAVSLEYTTDPVLELFDTAYSEWKTHHVYASRDRLELFLQNRVKIDLTNDKLRFVLESWFKCESSPQDHVAVYDDQPVIDICKNIVENEKDIELIDGAIKVLGSKKSQDCAEVLLKVIEKREVYQERNRETTITQFWFSRIREVEHERVADVLAQVLENDPSYKLRKEAAYTLRYYPNERTIKVLEAALNDSRSYVRANAVDSLASIRSSSSVKPLLDLLDSEKYSTKMRKKIVWALGHFSKDERVRKVLQSIAKDGQEHTEIIREARWSLSQLDNL